MLTGCGGGSVVTTPLSGPTLSGAVSVASLMIPAGQTTTVTSSLTLTSTGPVEIDGTLAIVPGASIAIFAGGPITINGALVSTQPAASTSAARRGAPSATAVRFPQADPPAPIVHVLDSKTITWNSSSTAPSFNPGDSLSLVTADATGTISIQANITLQRAAAGTDPTKAPGDPSGGAQTGGSIEIGTVNAQIDANAKGFTKAAAPATLTIGADVGLSAGIGGKGGNDINGTVVGNTVTMHSGNGANGGNIDLAAASSTAAKGAFLQAGDGGFGGSVGWDQKGTVFTTAVDGATGFSGLNLSARTGDGGNGGNLTGIPAGIAGFQSNVHGLGGTAGDLEFARAGNGSSGGTIVLTPGLSGGTTTVLVGSTGTSGEGGAAPFGPPYFPSIALYSGGSGGRAGSPPLAVQNGGNGGAVTITAVDGSAAQVSSITIESYANGGTGFNGCPLLAGSPGGNAGSLTIAGVAFTSTFAFTGGTGGSGNGSTPAAGGMPNGAIGANCSSTGVVLSPSGLQFTSTGAASAQTVTASEANYTGQYTASSSACAEIASISPATGTSFSVTPIGAGSCTFTFTDSGGKSAQLIVHVATTSIGGQ